ncbi:MAG: heme-binding domain-containing protein [Chloroflexi bacterium]|nr:heme-binding domain-containing protein [Chloroflexota bacterium]
MLKGLGIVGAMGLVAIQFIPYGRDHSNPPVVAEPAWASPQTRELAVKACYDCHSNQVTYPWYTNIAPVSWLVQHDVEEGRRELNFSEWNRPQRESRNMAREVERGEMPVPIYLLIHPEARLSTDENAALVEGLRATVVQSPPGGVSAGSEQPGGRGEGERRR